MLCVATSRVGEGLHKTPTEASLHSFHFDRLGMGLGMCLPGVPAAASCSELRLKDYSGVFC